jgi:hypothetical protein
MILEKNIKEIESGINEMIEEIEFLKSLDKELINLDSIGSVRGHLDNLEKIEMYENIMSKFHINHYEIEGNRIKIKP